MENDLAERLAVAPEAPSVLVEPAPQIEAMEQGELKKQLVEGIWRRIVGAESLSPEEQRKKLLTETGLAWALSARAALTLAEAERALPPEQRQVMIREKLAAAKQKIESNKVDAETAGLAAMISLRKELASPAMRLSEAEVTQNGEFDRYLFDNPKVEISVDEALVEVHARVMDLLSAGRLKEEEEKHAATVRGYASREPVRYQRVARIMALIHDFAKVVDERTILEAHAGTSARFDVKVVQALCEQLTEMGVAGITSPEGGLCGSAKLASKLFTHEEGEFPEVEAGKAGMDIEIDGMRVGVLFGLPYIYPEKSSEVAITEEGVEDGALREVLTTVSSADKIAGADVIGSARKYYLLYDTEAMFGHEDIDGLVVDKLMSSFIYNLRNAPETQIKRDFMRSTELRQSVVFLMLLRGEIGKGLIYDLRDDWKRLAHEDDAGLLAAVDKFRNHHKWVREKKPAGVDTSAWEAMYAGSEPWVSGEAAPGSRDRAASVSFLGEVVEAARGFDFSDKKELTEIVDKEIDTLFKW